MNLDELIKTLKETAIKCGAAPELIKYVSADKIVVTNRWVRWKCTFGCPTYGNNLCCPPFTPRPEDAKLMIQEYTHALLIGFKIKASEHIKLRKKMQRCILKIESKAFTLNFLKAFAFNVGGCVWCKTCVVKELPKEIDPQIARIYCKYKDRARPSMEAVGIDVFKSVENAGLELKIINKPDMDEAKFFGLLLIE
ncbi:MAG: DUF2284 domain-containing protein [Candidatus Hodarchaeota archaeon]